MKYEIKRHEDKKTFKPFSISIIIETREEYVYFHDKVMGKLSIKGKGSQDFYGHTYQAGNMELDTAKGKIE